MKRIRLAACALALCLLTGCASGAAGEGGAPDADSVSSGTICYVPLDDRPDNADRAEYLAESLGYAVDMPDADWYSTRLDGQPLNANGTQYGDRAALYDWVLEQEAAGCDRYILSLDQLLSGGLVNSRAMRGENPVTLSDGTVLPESALLKRLLSVLSADPNNRVWLLDTVMRLAPTTGYAGFGLSEYNALRTYGMEARPALSGDALTVDGVVAGYPVGTDGSLIACRSDSPLPDGAVQNYLASRERKLRLSDEAERILASGGYENFRLLVGIDDSSAENSIQKNEIALLRQGLRTGSDGGAPDWILSGVDDLAFKAVTGLYLEEMPGGSLAQRGLNDVYVDYFGGTEAKPACDYDYLPLKEIVAEHLSFFGLRTAPGRLGADLQLVVLTQPADSGRAAEYCQALVDRINDNEASGLPTILIDASNNAYGAAFHDLLTKQVHLGSLLAYSGFLDMAIVTGTALSHGVARYAWLCSGNGGDADAGRAFQKSLADSVILDFCYRNTVRDDLIAYIRDKLDGDPNNFYVPAIDLSAVQSKLEADMAESTGAVLKNFSHSNLIVSLPEYQTQSGGTVGWGALTLSGWSFPWSRAFEVRMDIGLEPLTAAHRRVLWFYV